MATARARRSPPRSRGESLAGRADPRLGDRRTAALLSRTGDRDRRAAFSIQAPRLTAGDGQQPTLPAAVSIGLIGDETHPGDGTCLFDHLRTRLTKRWIWRSSSAWNCSKSSASSPRCGLRPSSIGGQAAGPLSWARKSVLRLPLLTARGARGSSATHSARRRRTPGEACVGLGSTEERGKFSDVRSGHRRSA